MRATRGLWSLFFVLGMLFQAHGVPRLVPLARAAEAQFVAWVNGVGLPVEDFVAMAERKTPANGESLDMTERMEVVDLLIDEELLYREALRLGLDEDPKVKKVMTSVLLREHVYSGVSNADFTDEELQAYYNAHIEEFVIPEKVQIKHILVAVNAERSEREALELANQLYAELSAAPDTFKDVAASRSDDPYRRRGGDVGFVPRGGKPGLDQAIVDQAFALQVGEIAPPLRTASGYSIVMNANYRERVERTYAQLKGSVLRKVKNEALQVRYDEYVAKLRVDAKIKVDKKVVESIAVRAFPVSPSDPGLVPLQEEELEE